MEMKVTEAANGVTCIALDGRFDIAGAQQVDAPFAKTTEGAKALVVDMTNVSFIASLGVRTLMMSAKTLMRSGGDMAVCGANENVEKVLRSTGLNEVAGLYPDFASASAAIASRAAEFASRKA
jgi:anti-anti-sigma factor